MLDINFIRENPDKMKKACRDKNVDVDIDRVLALDKGKRQLQTEIEMLKAEQNKISRGGKDNTAIFVQAKEIKGKIKEMEPELEKIDAELKNFLLILPNVPFDDVPVGKDDSQNQVLRKVGSTPKFIFNKPKDYIELGEALDLIDTDRAGKVAGSRFGYIKRQLPILEFALVKLVMDTVQKEKFIPVIPPVMLKDQMARGTGYFEAADEKEAYHLPDDDMYLVGTSEQSLVSMYADEILDEKDLPIRYVGFSTCFRREAGSYRKEERGMIRGHQFNKVEMFQYTKPGESWAGFDNMRSQAEKLLAGLGLHFQTSKLAAG
ncbi:MAG: aminoacyl--tRNA ligase-related protein, partial [Candidatus Staskawiczbacteria bacterium]